MTKRETRYEVGQQWGGRENFPLMPATLVVARMLTDEKFTQATGVKHGRVVVEEDAKKDYVKWIIEKEEFKKFCEDCFKKIKKNPKIQKKLIKQFQKRVPSFLNFCQKVMKSNLKKKSNKELWEYYERYIKLYEDIYVWGESFAFGARFPLADYLRNYLERILKTKRQSEKFNEYFNTLVTPPQKPFLTEEKEALLKIALSIKRNPRWKNLFKKDLKTIAKEIIKFPKLNQKIEKHTEDWQWVPYNYGAYLFDKKHFLKELKTLIAEDKIEEELKKIKNSFGKSLENQQKKIVKELKIDQYHQDLFEALRWNGFIIDYKKKVFTISHFLINFSLMKEIAKRLNIEQKYAHCILRDEMRDALLKEKLVPLEVLKERFKKSVVFVKDGKIKLMVGKEGEDFLKKQGIEERKLEIKEFKGSIANPGKAKGKAKIIPGPKDFKKMKKGNILITHMTTPEFAPILKKAVAIVTDEGGITCHAAIISRELGIPCIIGTKIATKVLKDEDLVEVDAERGIVKILKQ